LTIRIDKTSANAAINALVDVKGQPGCSFGGCHSSVHISKLDFGGGASGTILNLLTSLLSS